MYKVLIAFVIVILWQVCVSSKISNFQNWKENQEFQPNSTIGYLDKTLTGLELVFEFFGREYRNINLDGIIGTRIVQASLNTLLARVKDPKTTLLLPAGFEDRLVQLRDEAKIVSDSATPFVMINDPQYVHVIGPVIKEGLFEMKYPTTDISSSTQIWEYNPNEMTDERDSDNCIHNIFGQWETGGPSCQITDQCWTLMTALGYNGYSLSHQIFYLEIAEQYGCMTEMEDMITKHKQTSLSTLQDVFCANMLAEANLIARNDFNIRYRDLFMEQAALCGLVGYREFFSNEWIDKILSWQHKQDGCWKWPGWPQEKYAPGGELRVKREEKRVSRGCLSHRSTVAASALVQYLRYIIEVYATEQRAVLTE